MQVSEIFKKHFPCLSFEFFPPKSEKASEDLFQTIGDLKPLKPSFVSVTYGAGGTTRDLTHDLVCRIHQETNIDVVSHLTCVGHTSDEIHQILEKYHNSGIQNIMALRGDPPKGKTKFEAVAGGFNYADELVAFIKKKFPQMSIGVAGFPEGHPESMSRLTEIDFLKAKVDAGADYICTQLFFDNRDYYDFCERCEIAGIKVPIVAGIMPITSTKNMRRISELASGSRFPAALLRSMRRATNDEFAEKVGIHWASEQVRDLIDNGVKGIHFYTLNKSKATMKIYESIGISSREDLSISEKKRLEQVI